MAVRIREDGRILCASMHPPEPYDLYIHNGLHYELSVEKQVLVTEPMYSKEGRGGHGEWWWVTDVPEDVVLENRK